MDGPEGAQEAVTADAEACETPPGHFLSPALASDCARFLADAKALAARRAAVDARGLGG